MAEVTKCLSDMRNFGVKLTWPGGGQWSRASSPRRMALVVNRLIAPKVLAGTILAF